MIRIENVSTYGMLEAVHGMRNPMNSWGKSDTTTIVLNEDDVELGEEPITELKIGPNDLKLMQSLVRAGTDHSKFMRMIVVYMDITAPLYWWKEFDTYKVGTVTNSCSTMHKVHDKEFTVRDFSTDLLTSARATQLMYNIIDELNENRKMFNAETDQSVKKNYFNNMIQLLPSSYNQKRTVQLNYQVLRNIYFSRKNHKLNEWINFCVVIKMLPYSRELICYI